MDLTTAALGAALGAVGLRQELLSANVANVNTPGYKRRDVNFDSILSSIEDAQRSNDGSALMALKPTVETDNATSMRADGNNVDIDMEMASIAENNVRYNALVQLAAKHLQMLESVASDGRK